MADASAWKVAVDFGSVAAAVGVYDLWAVNSRSIA
jgi:hypothetical protein